MKKGKKWSEEDIDYLTNNKDMSASAIAKVLGRSTAAVNQKRKQLHLKPNPKWNKEIIIKQIKARHLEGKNLKAGYMHTTHKPLYRAAYRIFGSWENAIEAAEIRYKDITTFEYWDDEKIIKAIRDRKKRGLSLSSHRIQNEYRALYVAACKHMGSWGIAVNRSGLDYDDIRLMKKWKRFSKKEIIAQIQEWNSAGELLNAQSIQQKYTNFEAQARRKFSSWEKVIEAAGLDYNDVTLHATEEIRRGLVFEKIMKNYFKQEKPEYKYHRRVYLKDGSFVIPDFIDEDSNIWIDCKLRCWTIAIRDTIEKYIEHSNELHFYYLIGTAPQDSNHIRYIKASDIIDEEKHRGILTQLRELETFVPVEIVTKSKGEQSRSRMDKKVASRDAVKRISDTHPKKVVPYVTYDELVERINEYHDKLGHFPRKKDIESNDKLYYHIQKFGGARVLSEKLGIPLKPRQCLYDWDKLQSELKEIVIELGRFPTKADLKRMGKMYLKAHIQSFGGSYEVARKMNVEYNRQKTGQFNNFQNLMAELIPICEQLGRVPKHVELQKMNKGYLSAAISKHGGIYKVVEELNYPTFRERDDSVNWEYVESQLNDIKDRIGSFPSLNYVKEHGSARLNTLITTHFGGMHQVARRMGEELTSRPPGYWTLERVQNDLLEIHGQIGRIPTRKDLKRLNKEYLIDPIKTFGGIHRLSETLGMEYIGRKPKGYYKDRENIYKELLPVCKELGRFPTQNELIERGLKNLLPILSREGGMRKIAKEMGFENKN